jgi:hypothetical protein
MVFGDGELEVSRACLGTAMLEQLGEGIAGCGLSPADEVLQKFESLHLPYSNPAPRGAERIISSPPPLTRWT